MINFETTPWVFPDGWGLKLENEFTSDEQSVSGAKTQDVPDFNNLSTWFSNPPENMSRTGTDYVAEITHVSSTSDGVKSGNVNRGSTVSNIFRDAMQTVNSFHDRGHEEISETQKMYGRDFKAPLQNKKDIGLLDVTDQNEDENKQKYITQKLVCGGHLVKYHDSNTSKDVKILREVCVSNSKNDNFIVPSQACVTVLKVDEQKHITHKLVSQREAASSEKGNIKHENSLYEEQQMHATQDLASQWNRNLSEQGNLKQENSFHEEMMLANDCENEEPLKEHKDLAIFYFEDPPEQQSSDLQNAKDDWDRPTYVDNVQPVSPRVERFSGWPNFSPQRSVSSHGQNFSSNAPQSNCDLISYPPDPHTTSQLLHNQFPRCTLLNKHSQYSWFTSNVRMMGGRALISHPSITPKFQQYPLGYKPPGKDLQISSLANNHSSSNYDHPPTFLWPQQTPRGNKFSGEIPQIYPQTNNHRALSNYHNPFTPWPRQSSQGDRFTDKIPQMSYQTNNHDSLNNDISSSEASIQSSLQANDESSSQTNGESSFQGTVKTLPQANGKSIAQVNDGHLSMANRESSSEASSKIIQEEICLREQLETNNQYKRQFCLSPENAQTNLEKHTQKHTKEVNGDTITDETLIKQGSSGNDKPYKCPFCPIRVQSKKSLERHVLRHTSEKQVTCPHCPFKCFDTTGLNSHLIMHSEERPFACPQCAKTWKRRSALERHLKCTHSNARPFSCDLCSATYKDRRDLRRHLLTHTTKRPYSCPQCPATFKTPDGLRHHIKIHSSEKLFTCAHCQARFSQKHHLKIHSKVHMNDKPYSCAHCPARFRWQGGLSQHMATHGERKLECAHCSARFRHKNNLRAHMRIHTGEKPHACTKCPARFREISTLKNHLQAHLNEKKFTCAHCSEGFRYKGRLQRHLETHCSKRPGIKRVTLRLTDDIKLTCVL